MTDPARHPRLGVSVCVWRDDEFLLIRRAKPPWIGLWAPVGGMVEWGETVEEAARREVYEEAGITCRVIAPVNTRDLIFRESDGNVSRHVVLAVVAAVWAAGEPVAGDDADAAGWFSHQTVQTVSLLPGIMPYVDLSRRALDAAG